MLSGITSEKMDLSHHGLPQTSIVDGAGNDAECMPGFSSKVVGNSLGQEVQPNMLRTDQREMLGSQPNGQLISQQHQHELHNPLTKNKVLGTHSCSLRVQPDIANRNHQLQQQTTALPNKPSFSLQMVLPVKPYRQTFGQSTSTVSQREGHTGMDPDDVSEQRKLVLCQKNMPGSSRHPFDQQADVSVVHQPKVIGPQSNVFNFHLHQPTTGVLQQSVAMVPKQKVCNATQPVQFHQIPSSQKQQSLSHDGMQQHLQMSAVSNKHWRIHGSAGDQQKLFHSQSMCSGASSSTFESKTPDELLIAADWHDRAFQKILEVKRKFGPKLEFLHRLFTSFCKKSASEEEIQGYKNKLRLIEKQIMFLSLQRFQMANMSKEKVVHHLEFIIKFVTCSQKRISASAEQSAHQQPGTQSQISQKPQNLNVRQQSYPVSLALTSSIGCSSPGSTMQPGTPISQPKSLFSPLQCSSRIGLENKDELGRLQHCANFVEENNFCGQWDKLSCNTIVNVYDSGAKHPTMPPQGLKHSMQLHNMRQKKKHRLMPHMEPGVTLEIKHPENLNHSLPLNNHQLCATSQNCRNSSPQFDQLTSLRHLPKADTSMQSANSPSVLASSSSMTPSPVPTDHEGHKSSVASLSERKGCLEALAGADTQSQVQPLSPAIGTSDVLASPWITAFTTCDGSQHSADAMQPLERLLKAVKSSSQKALSASIYEIELVVNGEDTLTGTANTDSAVGEDLASTTRCRLQAQDVDFPMRGTKRQISALASSTLISCLSTADSLMKLDSAGMLGNKRRSIEPNDLFDEIRYVNQQLLETVVEFYSTEDAAASPGGNRGIMVRCSFSAVAFNENFRAYASTLMSPVLSLWLLVPPSYPNSSPKVLEGSSSLGWSLGNKESEDLSDQAKLRFRTSLQKLSEPMSIGEMAKTWDVCARAVFFEQAQLVGGECFSSRYGSWENFIAT